MLAENKPRYNAMPKTDKHIEAKAIARIVFPKSEVKSLLQRTAKLPKFSRFPSNNSELYRDIKVASAKGYITWNEATGVWQ